MKRLLLACSLLLAFSAPAPAQNPTSKIVRRPGFVAGRRGDIMVHSATGVPYVCKSATCTSGGSGWASMDASAAAPAGSSGDIQTNSAGAFGSLTPGAGVSAFLATPSSANLASAVTNETGSGALVFGTSPTLTTPNVGAATATSVNGNTFTAGTYTLTGGAGKTLTFNNTLTFAGTDGTTMTFPSTTATIARTDAANTFTGNQSFAGVFSTYNNVSTAGLGVAPIRASVVLGPLTASVGTTSLYTAPATGLYRVCWQQTNVLAATTSSSLLTTIGYNNGGAKTVTVASLNGGAYQATADTTNTLNSVMQNCMTVNAASGTNITYATTYASSGAQAMNYALRITVEQLQ